ncbi:hypothetical protein [Tunturiibacter lichenicola]|uniref:hypothetical protein n=1 Tax=Tunturiibacter lichenicola TaxID=2051959 RepID=UPI003D9B4012
MREEDLELDDAIEKFAAQAEISDSALVAFLTNWAAHPDYYTDFTQQVISNLSELNVTLLNKLDLRKRFHLVKALCITVQLAFSMKEWEGMLGRKDGAWYWEKHGLFFSSLHGLIPPLNELQSQIAAIGEGFTGRIICLEGDSERIFLELLHYATRISQLDNHYFVYGGKGAHQNLVLYIKDKNQKGVRVDLAYDGDSNLQVTIPKLQQTVAINSVFRFERDFEAAFPPFVLSPTLTDYLKEHTDKPTQCSVQEVAEMLRDPRPFVKVVQSRFAININKVIFGRLLALEILSLSDKDHRVLHGAGLLTGTELSKFLRWVMGWPQDVSSAENDDGEIMFEVDPLDIDEN